MKDKDLMLLIGVGVAVWYFSRPPAQTMRPAGVTTSPVADQPPSLHRIARERRLAGYWKTFK